MVPTQTMHFEDHRFALFHSSNTGNLMTLGPLQRSKPWQSQSELLNWVALVWQFSLQIHDLHLHRKFRHRKIKRRSVVWMWFKYGVCVCFHIYENLIIYIYRQVFVCVDARNHRNQTNWLILFWNSKYSDYFVWCILLQQNQHVYLITWICFVCLHACGTPKWLTPPNIWCLENLLCFFGPKVVSHETRATLARKKRHVEVMKEETRSHRIHGVIYLYI